MLMQQHFIGDLMQPNISNSKGNMYCNTKKIIRFVYKASLYIYIVLTHPGSHMVKVYTGTNKQYCSYKEKKYQMEA